MKLLQQWAGGYQTRWPPLKKLKFTVESVQYQPVVLSPFSDKTFNIRYFLKQNHEIC